IKARKPAIQRPIGVSWSRSLVTHFINTRQSKIMFRGAHLDTASGAPASGTAPLHEPEPKAPGRRPALCHPISLLVAVSRCAPFRVGRGRILIHPPSLNWPL